jgi:hypothetical protein
MFAETLRMESFSFSKELIAECQTVFLDENGILLTNEQADECLRGFAGLFRAFADGVPQPPSAPPSPCGGEGRKRGAPPTRPSSSTGVRNTCGVLQDAP